jgi:ATP-dependent DNA ligase
VLRLPEPMLTRAAPIPVGGGWLFDPKLDGFRCLVCTHGRVRVRSRRGWDMTALLPELHSLPDDVQPDGEIVALDEVGRPDFHRLESRLLHGRRGIAVVFFVFDVLTVERLATRMLAYEAARAARGAPVRKSARPTGGDVRRRTSSVPGHVRARP